MDRCIEASYRTLAAAIVLRAFEDGVDLLRRLFRGHVDADCLKKWHEIQDFVTSDQYRWLTDIPPETFLKRMIEAAWDGTEINNKSVIKERKERLCDESFY